jgi:hypothetical protein
MGRLRAEGMGSGTLAWITWFTCRGGRSGLHSMQLYTCVCVGGGGGNQQVEAADSPGSPASGWASPMIELVGGMDTVLHSTDSATFHPSSFSSTSVSRRHPTTRS